MVAIILLIAVCSVNVLLAAFVFASNSRAQINRVFSALAFTLAIWSIVSFLEDTAISHAIVRGLVIADFALSAIMLGLFYWFCYIFTSRKLRWLSVIINVLTATSVALSIVGLMVRVEFESGRVHFMEQAGYPVFIALAAVSLIAGLAMLIGRYRKSVGREREQLRFIFLGLFLMSFLLILTNVVLPNFFVVSSTVTRLGIYSILFFTGLCSYVIIKHRLFNFRRAVARSIAYALLLLTLALLYGFVSFGASSLVFQDSTVSRGQEAFNIVIAIILAFTFQPLRRFFERLTDRVFYRDRYDSQVVLSNIGKILASELMLEPLMDKTLQELCSNLRIETGQFMIFDEQRIYKVGHFGPLPKRLMVAPTTLKLRQAMLVADELEGGERKQIMEEHGVRISLMLRTREEFVGFLFLGDKLSGDIYSDQDLKLLEILASELAVAITNAKAYEEIEQFNITLQDRVNKATARLRVANRNLKELDKAKDEFISMASHQLRTPLTTIKGYISMMLEGDSGKVSREQKEFLDYAFEGAERMVALISDLLNVSRLSAGRFVIEKVPSDIVAVVSDEVRQLQSHAEAKQLTLKFIPPEHKLGQIMLDEGKTRQVIMNFIDNAIYYTKKGSITVSLEFDKQKVYLRVRDNGIGVPEAAKAKLFTKFFRADNAQVARPDGTGLGLYLAKRVVEDQGGTILFESTEGKGSMFGFSLPILAAPAKVVTEPKAPVRIKAKVHKVKAVKG
jgi:signal transduction histidine kinase